MIALSSARARLTQRLIARATGGGPVDLSSLEAVPRRLLRPLRRSGLDPVHRIGASAPDPVHRLAHMFGMNIWLVSGQEEAKAVLADQRRFSNDIRPYVGAAGASVGGLGFTDPPEHTRLRALLTPEFTMRRINRLTPRIEAIVDEQLDRMEANGPVVDLVEQFAFPIPFLVI
jgi:cytochrome P450